MRAPVLGHRWEQLPSPEVAFLPRLSSVSSITVCLKNASSCSGKVTVGKERTMFSTPGGKSPFLRELSDE